MEGRCHFAQGNVECRIFLSYLSKYLARVKGISFVSFMKFRGERKICIKMQNAVDTNALYYGLKC